MLLPADWTRLLRGVTRLVIWLVLQRLVLV
jgi:hypothetical protein